MTFAECNDNQKAMWRVVCREANMYIGGLENTTLDYPEDSDDYKNAINELKDTDGCIEYVMYEVFHSLEWERLSHLHFVTKEWVEERCRRLTKKILRESREELGIN